LLGSEALGDATNNVAEYMAVRSEALGDATNNVAEYMAVRNALRAAADAGATSAHVRMDSPVVLRRGPRRR
jgi:ribonuclease HI